MTESVTLFVLVYSNGPRKLYVGGGGDEGIESAYDPKQAQKFITLKRALSHLEANPKLRVAEFAPIPLDVELDINDPFLKQIKEEQHEEIKRAEVEFSRFELHRRGGDYHRTDVLGGRVHADHAGRPGDDITDAGTRAVANAAAGDSSKSLLEGEAQGRGRVDEAHVRAGPEVATRYDECD